MPSENSWRQDFEKYATVYDLTSFLEQKNWISFTNYIINKCNIDIIFNSNSQFGYNMLPYLKAKYNDIPIIDYVHMEEWYNRCGGFSRDSSKMASVIDKTYTCNGNSKNVFINYFGRKEEEIKTIYIGVDEKIFNPELFDKEEILKKYKINKDGKFIISFICRIADQKRPFLFAEIIKELSKKREDFLVVIAGEGPFLEDLKKKFEKYGISDKIKYLGNISETQNVYKISDLTLNCSIKEGLALTSYESLSMGVPVVSADVGGQKELISEDTGIIVPCLQDETEILNFNYKEEEVINYVQAIEKVLNNIEKYKKSCRKRILEGFTIDNMVKNMDKEFQEIMQNPNKEKIENGKALAKNIDITKELVTECIRGNKDDYEWAAKDFNKNNIHIILKYDKEARKKEFYEHTLEYKIKHPFVVFFRKLGIYDKLKKIFKFGKH